MEHHQLLVCAADINLLVKPDMVKTQKLCQWQYTDLEINADKKQLSVMSYHQSMGQWN
jgi:hypothetical protein